MTRSRRIALVALALVGAAAIILAYALGRTPNAAPRVETQKVERGSLVAKVTASGTLSALVTVQVGSQVSGRIKEVLVDFNSQVKKGQVIARLDPQLFTAAFEQAKANHAVAQANVTRARVQLADAERQFVRAKAIFDKQLGAQADLDAAQTARDAAVASVSAAEAGVAQARAALSQAQVNLDYCTVHSPIDGIVISRNIDVGQTVAASLAAPTLFSIAEDLRKMQVDTNVAEADIGKIQPQLSATFTVDAFAGEKFRGRVRQIRHAPISVQNVVTYDAVIDVDNPELKLKPGMTATVTFIVSQKDDVLKLANAALRFRPPPDFGTAPRDTGTEKNHEGGRPRPPARPELAPDERMVWRSEPSGAIPTQVKVKLGVSDGAMTEIVEGDLLEGDLLITDVSDGGAKARSPSLGPMRLF